MLFKFWSSPKIVDSFLSVEAQKPEFVWAEKWIWNKKKVKIGANSPILWKRQNFLRVVKLPMMCENWEITLIAQFVKRRPWLYSWVGKILWRRDRLPTPMFLGFPCGSAGKKNPPAMWDTWLWSLGWEDPLEEGKATHSSILPWRIPWTV